MNEMNRRETEVTEPSGSGLSAFQSLSDSEKNEKRKRKNTRLAILVMALVTVLLMLAVNAGVKLNESTIQASALKSEVRALEKQNREYRSSMEKKNNMVSFEQYAIEELGMLKSMDPIEEDRTDKIE